MTAAHLDSFGAASELNVGNRSYTIYRLDALKRAGFAVERLPYSLRILLENLLRTENGASVLARSDTTSARKLTSSLVVASRLANMRLLRGGKTWERWTSLEWRSLSDPVTFRGSNGTSDRWQMARPMV
jgi:hypothetical protein